MSIGEKVIRLRLQKGWIQAQLAEKSGLSQSTINTLEKRTKRPDAIVLNAVAIALGTTVENLLKKEDQK